MRFLGNIEAKTDAKGRVFLPSTFRKVLQASGEELLVMRKDIHQKCLVLYPESVWNKRVDALRASISEWDDEGMMVLRQYMQDAEVIILDGNGRFLIKSEFLAAAEIDHAVRFIGMTDFIEIWAADKAEQPFMSQAEFSSKLKALMTGSGGFNPFVAAATTPPSTD
ncbi:MAG: cell division/cell wall cluster transcriptional repressor MraZ [Prevotella sp.]|nr:cell division/cell wall cluster transcriptional repressor MraZ [Prevotella sp.]